MADKKVVVTCERVSSIKVPCDFTDGDYIAVKEFGPEKCTVYMKCGYDCGGAHLPHIVVTKEHAKAMVEVLTLWIEKVEEV